MRSFKEVLLTTTNNFEGLEIEKYLDVMSSNVVIGTNVLSDFGASFTDFFGGFSNSYQNKLNLIYTEAISALKKKALNAGANAIIGLRIDFDEISGKGKSMFMISACGTAVVLKKNTNELNSSTSHIEVALEDLEYQVKFDMLLKKLEKAYLPDEEDWNLIFIRPNETMLNILIEKYIKAIDVNYDSEKGSLLRENLPIYVKSMQSKSVIEMIYTKLEENIQIVQLIKSSKIFDPKLLNNLINKGKLKEAVCCLPADKDSYSQEDLIEMNNLIHLLENLPNKGSIEQVKQLLSKSKDKYVCPNKHINDIDLQFCTDNECGLDIKGLTANDYTLIENFKIITKTLEKLFT
ncbi:hypothetical protein SDC9_20255 [bioreactor metagenome]|uniref:Uncharacterized protein n=1 Tax=bioreactor metagenome TaxID=1076179 RepID=A0A644U662_9ZZZZ